MSAWGLSPDDVRALLLKKEWASTKNLRERLLGQRPFPLRVSLKVPTGAQALKQVDRFHAFIKQWKQSPQQHQIQWVQKQYRELGSHNVPASLSLDSMQQLIEFLGPKAMARGQRWEQRMAPILDLDANLYPVLVRHLPRLEQMSEEDTNLIAKLILQLHPNIGRESYLRALPLQQVDTKFLENNFALIADLLDAHLGGAVSQANGLMNWLGCVDIPKAWLLVRPLCPQSRQRLCGLPILQLTAQTLRHSALPARNILIVENNQSGYGLPQLADTIAVFGGGANVSWLDADWLHDKHIAYWGDIDTWGFKLLSDARQHLPSLNALMMDDQTFSQFQQRAVPEPSPVDQLPPNLFAEEIELFDEFQRGRYRGQRLEQERISADYIADRLQAWLTQNTP
jgi:hypothetical protein